jgi:hypothetical protein
MRRDFRIGYGLVRVSEKLAYVLWAGLAGWSIDPCSLDHSRSKSCAAYAKTEHPEDEQRGAGWFGNTG